MSNELGVDVFANVQEEDEAVPTFDAKKQFDKDIWKALSDCFGEMVKACQNPDLPYSYISIDTADAVVGGKFKKNQGKRSCYDRNENGVVPVHD